ncbi:MAG: hypothetical protein ACXVJT_15505, partial [Thermoanaerobaculia bacterium]
MREGLIHGYTRREICALARELQRSGRLYGPPNDELHDVFKGSVDRFCEIADRLRYAKRVLDVGAGHGMLLALLHELGHYCEGVDFTDPRPAHSAVYSGRRIAFQHIRIMPRHDVL